MRNRVRDIETIRLLINSLSMNEKSSDLGETSKVAEKDAVPASQDSVGRNGVKHPHGIRAENVDKVCDTCGFSDETEGNILGHEINCEKIKNIRNLARKISGGIFINDKEYLLDILMKNNLTKEQVAFLFMIYQRSLVLDSVLDATTKLKERVEILEKLCKTRLCECGHFEWEHVPALGGCQHDDHGYDKRTQLNGRMSVNCKCKGFVKYADANDGKN